MIDISVMFYAKSPSGVEEEAKRWLKKNLFILISSDVPQTY